MFINNLPLVIQRVVDNMFLIKILKEDEEINKFATTLENLNKSDYKHINFHQ